MILPVDEISGFPQNEETVLLLLNPGQNEHTGVGITLWEAFESKKI